jgi:hypothetical protein
MKNKFILFVIVAALFCACEEGTTHVTPKYPIIAHLMCVEITKIPAAGYYTCGVFNAITGEPSRRIPISDEYYSQKDLPIKLVVDGGQRLDKETYILAVFKRNEIDATPELLVADSIPSLTCLINRGYPEEIKIDYSVGLKGKLYIRYD